MKEKLTARVYAKSFLSLAEKEKFDLADDFTKLTEAINASNDFENVLFLEVFSSEEKSSVFNDIAKKLNLNKLTANCVNYLISERRVELLPLITKEIIVLDDEKKGFLRGTIEGAEDKISDSVLKEITTYITKKLNKEPKLSYHKSDSVTAGYRVTVDDLLLDASLDNQLDNLKQTILN